MTRPELRKFGLTVGGAFAVFGVLSWARGHEVAPRVLWILSAALVVPALAAPGVLGPVQRVWMRAAATLGHINTQVILTVLFYVLIAPVGFVLRRFRDPLGLSMHSGRSSHWIKRDPERHDPARYEQQF